MKKAEMIVERTKTGYSAYSPKYSIVTTGKTLAQLKTNMIEALNLYFEESGIVFKETDLKVTLDLPQFFTFYKVINAKALSECIGMNQSLLAQYVSGLKKPSAAQVKRILTGIQQIGRELAEIQLIC